MDGRGVKLAEVFRLNRVRIVELWAYRVGKFMGGVVRSRDEAKRIAGRILEDKSRTKTSRRIQ